MNPSIGFCSRVLFGVNESQRSCLVPPRLGSALVGCLRHDRMGECVTDECMIDECSGQQGRTNEQSGKTQSRMRRTPKRGRISFSGDFPGNQTTRSVLGKIEPQSREMPYSRILEHFPYFLPDTEDTT